MKHLKPLTSLRFFAAFVVVLCHMRYAHGDHLPVWAMNFAKNGFVGVNLFFVLSGFVIAYNYGEKFLDKATTFKNFMVARFARIWPAFVTALLLALPVYVFRYEENLAKLPLMAPVHLLLIHNRFPNLGASWLSPSWTIGTEWGFYLMFPLFAAAVFRLRERGLWTLLIVSALLTLVGPALYHSGLFAGLSGKSAGGDVVGEDFWGRVLRWYSFFRLPEFMVGVCVCRLFMLQTYLTRDKWAKPMGWIALVSLAVIVWVMVADTLPLMYINQAVLTLPFAAIIWFLAFDRGLTAKWMSVPILILFGEASYSLYLIHLIVKQVGIFGGRQIGLREDSIPLTIAIIIGAIAASILIFLFIEKPSRRWIVGKFGDHRKPDTAQQESAEAEPVSTAVAP